MDIDQKCVNGVSASTDGSQSPHVRPETRTFSVAVKDATRCHAMSAQRSRAIMATTTVTAAAVTAAAGSVRARRWRRNALLSTGPAADCRSHVMVMRYPEITKNTSTPNEPPWKCGTPEWYARTDSTAIARRSWMSHRCPMIPVSVPPVTLL